MILLFIGTWELILIVAIAIIVVSPENIMIYARRLGRLYQKMIRMFADIRSEITLSDIEEQKDDDHNHAG